MTLSEKSKQQLRKALEDMRQEILDEVRVQIERARVKDHVGDLGDYAAADMASVRSAKNPSTRKGCS
jgi:hypothetical protein